MSRGKHGNHRSSVDHPRWNKDKMVSSHGYVRLRVGREHPLSDPNGYAYEHLIIWAAAGRELPGSDQILHHKNKNKTDNRIENLELTARQKHSDLHGKKKITDDQVVEIRVLFTDGKYDMKHLAFMYGISKGTVRKIVKRRESSHG